MRIPCRDGQLYESLHLPFTKSMFPNLNACRQIMVRQLKVMSRMMKDHKCDLSKKETSVHEILVRLKSTEKGLSSYEAAKRLQIFGANKVKGKKILGKQERNVFRFLRFMWNPLSWIMELLALAAVILALCDGRPLYSLEFVGIIMLLAINSTVCLIVTNYAKNAVRDLMSVQPAKAKVLRDECWIELDAVLLVPGDIIYLKAGDIVHADICLLKGEFLMVDDFPPNRDFRQKYLEEWVFYGSHCRRGEMAAVVIATGVHCFYANKRSQKRIVNVAQHKKILKSVIRYLICLIAVAMVIQVTIMSLAQSRNHNDVLDNLLALLIGGLPAALPPILLVTMAIGSHTLSNLGILVKQFSAVEGMATMDVLCINKTGSLTLNTVSGYRNLVQVFEESADKDHVILLAARASQTENQNAIDAAIVRLLNDPKEARAGIVEVHFLPFLTANNLSAITYEDSNGNWHRVAKGSPKTIMDLCSCSEYTTDKIRSLIKKFAKDGFQLVAVARQEVQKKEELNDVFTSLFKKRDGSSPWTFVGMIPLFDPLRHDSVEIVRQLHNIGVRLKMITGDQYAISKEVARRLGMGANIYPANLLFKRDRDPLPTVFYGGLLIENFDGITEMLEVDKYGIVSMLRWRNHICGVVGEGAGEVLAMQCADFSLTFPHASEVTRRLSDVILAKGEQVALMSAVLTSRAIFQRMKNCMTVAISNTVYVVLSFLLISLIWKFNISPLMVLLIVILNDVTTMTMSMDWSKPSTMPEAWVLREIFGTGVLLGGGLAWITVSFFVLMRETRLFSEVFKVRQLVHDNNAMMSALYLQVSITSQAMIFISRIRSWCPVNCPGPLLFAAFMVSQLVSTLVAVYADWDFASITGVGWGWAGVIWLHSASTIFALGLIKFVVNFVLSLKSWDDLCI